MPFCKECYKERNPSVEESKIVLSSSEEICEACGKTTNVVTPYDVMTVAECKVVTQKHIETVRKYIRFMTDKITQRGVNHDATKLETPEVELFAEYTNCLSSLVYGSDEYKASLEKLKPALDHHYAKNRHHPEHFDNGVSDMTLIDIIEMFCDWKASTLRHNDGNLLKSIEINSTRFKMDPQLTQIFKNTARMIDEHEE